MNPLLLAAINARNSGNQWEAILLLKHLILSDPKNIEAWFWLARVLPEPEKKQDCYRHILKLDANNLIAKTLLQAQLELHPVIEKPNRQSSPQVDMNIAIHGAVEQSLPEADGVNRILEIVEQENSKLEIGTLSQLKESTNSVMDPRSDQRRICPACGLIAETEDIFCIQCGRILPAVKSKEQPILETDHLIERVASEIPNSPRLPLPCIDLPEVIPYSTPPKQPVPNGEAQRDHTPEPQSHSHLPQQKNREKEIGPQTRHWMVKLGILIINFSFFMPWMYGSVQSLFGSNSGSFGVFWLIENMDETAVPISLVFILSWAAFLLAIKPRRRLAKFFAGVAVICQIIVMFQIDDIAGWSNYGYGTDFLGGLFTGSVYVEVGIGTYAALLASFLILIGLFLTRNEAQEDQNEEVPTRDEMEDRTGLEHKTLPMEKKHAPAKQSGSPEPGSWFYIKRGLLIGIATGLGTTFAAGPLAGIPAAIMIFIYVGFFYKDKRINAKTGV